MTKKEKMAEFKDAGYEISVSGRHVQVTDAMKSYAIEKVQKIERFTDRIIDVSITMDIQRVDHRVDIVMSVGHLFIKSSAVTTDMYASIDQAVQKITKQLRRYKRRIQEHQARGIHVVDMSVNVLKREEDVAIDEINEEIEALKEKELVERYKPHEVVSTEKKPLKTLSIDEAIMKMELTNDAFMIFRHEEDRKIKVIYRRNDENFGIITPE